MPSSKTFLLIDSNSLLRRAFHALPPLTTKEGQLVNAVYGFFSIFLKVWRQARPDFTAAVFDLPQPTFRHQAFPEYKIHRPPTPVEFSTQIPLVKEILPKFGVEVFEKAGFEADDVIGTLARNLASREAAKQIVILSNDRDFLQLVSDRISVLLPGPGKKETIIYDQAKVRERYGGLEPEQLVDLKALVGDQSDNIPGVPGIGEKTAVIILQQFGSLEKLYSSLGKGRASLKAALVRKLRDFQEQAFLSQKLARIHCGVTLDLDFPKRRPYDRAAVEQAFRRLGFASLAERLPERFVLLSNNS